MRVSELISISPGFQRSVNIRMDITNEEKIASYIPTEKSENVIAHVSSALFNGVDDGAVMLIGSYGTGKSHLATLLASFAGKTVHSFCYERVIEKISDLTLQTALKSAERQPPYLVVTLSGSDEISLDLQLLKALKRALENKNVELSLNTSFTTALETMGRWENDYPNTYQLLDELLTNTEFTSATKLRKEVEDFNEDALSFFAEVYPLLTSGAKFDYFSGKVDEVYEEACLALSKIGYKGIMLVFDEFNKVMDDLIEDHQALKVMQDLAELACRSDKGYRLNVVLISHKTISQYVGAVDTGYANEWRKIEGRFRIFDVSNKPWETYELMGRVLKKTRITFYEELSSLNPTMETVSSNPRLSQIFEGLNRVSNTVEELVLKGCLPLHPVSVFLLPRVSAKLAQNERTLFTFLSGHDGSPIPGALYRNVDQFEYILPWQLYDYFEGQIERSNDPDIKAVRTKVANALDAVQTDDNVVLSMTLKTIGLIQLAGNSINLPCTKDMVSYALLGHKPDIALEELEQRKLILIRANQEIDIIEPSDFNADEAYRNWEQSRDRNISPFDILNCLLRDYVIPHRYNHENKITRYLTSLYVGVKEWDKHFPLCRLAPDHDGLDGVICYLLPESTEQLRKLEELVSSVRDSRVLFVFPRKSLELTKTILRTTAFKHISQNLREIQAEDRVIQLAELYYQDYLNILHAKITELTSPNLRLRYFHEGVLHSVKDEHELSKLCSEIMEKVYPQTPIFNNELINKTSPTITSRRARNDVIDAILNESSNLRADLRSAQERFMLDTLFIKPQFFNAESSSLNFTWPQGYEILNTIEDYFIHTNNEKADFSALLKIITAPPYGVRAGVVPALLAVCIMKLKEYVTIKDTADKDCQINAALFDKILDNPQNYFIKLETWNGALEKLTTGIAEIFGWSKPKDVFFANGFNDLGYEVFKWFSGLPRYARETRTLNKDAKLLRNIAKIAAHRPRQALLAELPTRLDYQEVTDDNVEKILSRIDEAKLEVDHALIKLTINVKSNIHKFLITFGNSQESLRSLALNMAAELSSGSVNLEWGHVTSYISEFKGYDENAFISGLTHKLVGVRLEDWLDTTYDELNTVLHNIKKARQQASASSSGPRVELLFCSNNGNEKITVQACEVSSLGETLQEHLENAVNNFGDAITAFEKRQILLNLLYKMCR